MTTKRNGYGQLKHDKPNRDFRRKHAHGFFRRESSMSEPELREKVAPRLFNALRRWFL